MGEPVAGLVRPVPFGWDLIERRGDGMACHRGPLLAISLTERHDGELWQHVSVSRKSRQLPDWDDLRKIKDAFMGPDALALIVIPPADEHFSLPGVEVMHLWCNLERRPTPDFRGSDGTI